MESFVQKLIGQVAKANQKGGQSSMMEDNEIPVMAAEPRKGIFGLKGTARDIVGLLGDAFLVQGGADPIYLKRRQEEAFADSLNTFGSDPQGAIAALAGTPGGAEQARKMMDDLNQDINRRGTLKNTMAKTAAEIEEKKLEREGIVAGRVASMMDAVKDNPTAWKMMKDQVLKYAAAKDVTLPYDIPDSPDENFIYREVSPEGKARLEDTKEYRAAQTDIKREEVAERKRSNAEEERDQRLRTAASAAGTYSEAAKRLDDIQNPKGPKARRSAPIKLKEGDPIWKDGKKYVIKNGKPVPAK